MELSQPQKNRLLDLLERYVTAHEKDVEAKIKAINATIKKIDEVSKAIKNSKPDLTKIPKS